MTIP